jgi:hypothetical protein
VVASDTAPVREVIKQGHNGILVPFFDTAALADRLINALASPEKYRNVRREARLTVTRDYSFKHSSLPVFHEILGSDERDKVGDHRRTALHPREPVRTIPALRGTRHALQTT